MPLPVILPVAPDANDQARGVFISYSHKDAKAAERLFNALGPMIEADPGLRLSKERVFYDKKRLKAAEQWREELQRALESSQVFIFLVSDDSLNSEFCRKKELEFAVARGMIIFAVILKKITDAWARIPIGVDATGKQWFLGDRGVLPKDDGFQMREISQWGKPDAAWAAVTAGISATLRSAASPMPQGMSAPAAVIPGAAPLLPFLCDRSDPISRFEAKFQARAERALLLILKGIPHDAAAKFWDRLVLEYLTEDAENRGIRCQANRPWAGLPTPEYVLEDRGAADSLVLSSLLRSLSGRLPAQPSIAALEAALQNGGGLMPVYATLRPGSAEAQCAIVTALVQYLERCASGIPSRLAVCLSIEQPDLFGRRLLDDWKLGALKNTLGIEVGPLPLVEWPDVREWHLVRQIEDKFAISEGQLEEAVGTQPQRMASFRERVAPLLGLTRNR